METKNQSEAPDRIPGSDYYEMQASARGINGRGDVERMSHESSGAYARAIEPWLPKAKDGEIYEVACGPGIMQVWLKENGFTEVWGSDFSEKEAEVAATINPNIKHGDSVSGLLERGESRYEAIIALDFLEHIPRDLVIPFLENALKALKPGGTLIMRAPNADSPIVGKNLFNDMTHVWAYTTCSLRAMTRVLGYSGVEFADDTINSIHKHRWIKLPLILCAQAILKVLFSTACRARVEYFGSSIYIYARR